MDTTEKVQELYLQALEREEEERTSFLEEACGDNAELREEVERLLAKSKEVDSFFGEREVDTIRDERSAAPMMASEGDRVGPYVLRQQIGEGGFGVVWMAEQTGELSRMVAVKVVKAGMDTKEVLNRFEAERQALAMMDHPNIARVFDAGATESGRLYFAMELIKGVPITKFCEQKKLDIGQRLALFKDVCSALSHAHQKGIIHRDLKPSNAMVTLHGDQPVVKIIDFGIAKATHSKLTEKTLFTRFEQFLGTPAYMSPEQAVMSGLDIDTRSDIYSLGILLYELLTGKPPFEAKSLLSAGYDEMRRIIAEDEPPMPSKQLTTLQAESETESPALAQFTPSELRGDLDWIVMKAIDKDRSRRYGTANDFAADIDRYLVDEPVEAAAPNPLYLIKKFVRRNRVALGTAAAFVVLLAIGIATATPLAVRAIREKKGSLVEEELVAQQALAAAKLAEQEQREWEALRREEEKLAKAKEILGFKGDVTPETLIAALDAGLFAYPLDKGHPEQDQPSSWGGPIRLGTRVRGEGDQGGLYSPVLDLLSVVATPNGAVTEESILKLDQKLVELSNKSERYRIEAGVAATVFAFQRGDVKSAMQRIKDLRFYGDYYRSRSTPFDLNLWLAVRMALNLSPQIEQEVSYRREPEETIAIAKRLAEYAILAARNSDDPREEQALLRERAKLLQLDRLELAKAAFARGDREKAKEILRTLPGVGSAGPFTLFRLPKFDSDAAVAFKLAELLVEESDWSNAADAYLEAYRGEIRLLSSGHVATFKKCGRTTEFVQTLIEKHVVRVDAGYLPISIVELLLEDENTRADGDLLLKHLWASPRSILISRLLGQKEIWKQVPDLSYYLRARVVPENFETAGAGWTLFEVRAFAEYSEEPVSGFPLRLEPLLQDKAALRKLSKEIAVVIEQQPDWKAGPAVLAFLEAEVGNYPRAIELVRQVLEDAETLPIPSDSALLLGLALEGRDDELDRQVMRLYESSLRNRPERVSRVSAIPRLARLHAKFDQRPEARQFLHRMTTINYDPKLGSPICVYGRSAANQKRCSDCHSGKSNLLDVCLMSDALTDIGYPVDSLISLARIDASFGNAYGSDDAWTKETIPEDFYSGIGEGRSKFVPLKSAAIEATTPQAVLEALKSGVFSGRDMTKPVATISKEPIDLMLSIRGEEGQPTVFSPVLEVLEMALESKEDGAVGEVAKLDEELLRLSEANPEDLQTLVATTAFAFLRNDLPNAKQRVKKLQGLGVETSGNPNQADAVLWLVARYALMDEQTEAIGVVLAERAIAAASQQPASRVNEAILRERSGIGPRPR